jgi:hypothetical protein
VLEGLGVELGVGPPPADFVLDLGLGEGDGAFATVTVGAVAVAVSAEPPLGTETVAENLIVSPAVAVFGTVTCSSTCESAGFADCKGRSQLVLVGRLVQLSTVNTGALNAGVLALGVTVVVIVPFSCEVDHAEIRNRMVPPVCTDVADAETATLGFVGGVGVGVVVGGVVVGGGSVGVDVGPGAAEVTVALDVGVGVGNVATGLDDAVGLDVAAVLDAPVVDGAAEAEGEAAAMAFPVMPLEMTKRPVARPSVTGLACGDRMRTPCLCVL